MKNIIPLLLSFCFFVGCASTGVLGDYYKSFIPDDILNNCPDECLLEPEQEPKVFYSSNLDDDIDSLRSNYFGVLTMDQRKTI